MSSSPIIPRLNQFLVGDPGVLDGVSRVGVTELPLNRRDIAGFLDDEEIREQVEDIAVKRSW